MARFMADGLFVRHLRRSTREYACAAGADPRRAAAGLRGPARGGAVDGGAAPDRVAAAARGGRRAAGGAGRGGRRRDRRRRGVLRLRSRPAGPRDRLRRDRAGPDRARIATVGRSVGRRGLVRSDERSGPGRGGRLRGRSSRRCRRRCGRGRCGGSRTRWTRPPASWCRSRTGRPTCRRSPAERASWSGPRSSCGCSRRPSSTAATWRPRSTRRTPAGRPAGARTCGGCSCRSVRWSVFAASNFPFAFSVAGGDTAAALAVGCPVVLKANPGHPLLSDRTGELVSAALAETGVPAGAFARGARRRGGPRGRAWTRGSRRARSPGRSPAGGRCSTWPARGRTRSRSTRRWAA